VRGTPVGRHEQGMGALWPDVVMALGQHSFSGVLAWFRVGFRCVRL